MARLIDADAIRRKAVPHTRGERAYCADIKKWAVLVSDIDEAPTIEAKPVVHGEIIEIIDNGKMKRVFSCCNTVCTQLTMWLEPNYCPNCGADMRERKET